VDELSALKQRVIEDVDSRREELIRISDTIHARPELGFEEFEAAALLTSVLEKGGFAVQRGVAGMETSFLASQQGRDEGPTVAFLAEYDALPGLGHACGHNIIGTAAVGAGLATKAVLAELPGTIWVVGTPAEEGGGGKAIMVDAGVFAKVDAAMMVHPSDKNLLGRLALTAYPVRIEFFGKAAHAAAKPEEGINALEALLLTFASINALRQHLRDDARIHGIITHGGDAANIVPDHTKAGFIIRAADTPYATEVLEKVRACAEGAALATGARLTFELSGPRYDARWPNPKLVELFKENLVALGLEVELATGHEPMGSSDIGNVSQVVPAIHPYLAIAPEGIGGHTVEFREAAASPAGHEALLNAAKAMAMTAVDLLFEPENMAEARRAFRERKSRQNG
jgi:amidohydrolase